MNLSEEKALELLYGKGTDPVCAVNLHLEPVWTPDRRAAALLPYLTEEMVVSQNTGEPAVPLDGTVLFRGPEQEPLVCRIQRLELSDERLYLLQFSPAPAYRELTPVEIRTLLRTQTDISRNAVPRIMQAVHFAVSQIEDAADRNVQSCVKEAEDACYAILNGCVRCEEMFWYASFDAMTEAEIEVQELRIPIRRFIEQITRLTAGSLTVSVGMVDIGMYAKVDANRLFFALILMFLTTHGGDGRYSEMEISAQNIQDKIEIRMSFSKGKQQKTCFHEPAFRDISFSGNVILLERFCDVFGAKIIRETRNSRKECILCIPGAEPDYGSVPLSASIAQYETNAFSMMHVLLSDVIHAADFPAPKE